MTVSSDARKRLTTKAISTRLVIIFPRYAHSVQFRNNYLLKVNKKRQCHPLLI